MSLLYKASDEVKHKVQIKQEDGFINLLFTADCGKHGTDEILDKYSFTPKALLLILQKHFDYE